MAATAYAALVSLLNTMDQIQIHPFLSTCFDNFQFESLREKVDFLVDFMENHRSEAAIGEEVGFVADADSAEEENLLSRIAVVAQIAEDLIEVEAADLIVGGSFERIPYFFHDLQMKIQDMDSIIKEVEESGLFINSMSPPLPLSSSPSSSTAAAPLATMKDVMVGFGGYLEQLLDELTSLHSGRRILPIVGMGGIGKTTLARNVYQNPLIVYHFDVRVWVTVSQEFNAKNILLQALSCVCRTTSNKRGSDDEVGEQLYKKLSGTRYLIVLDDVWSSEAWEKIKFFFPDNDNRSRIVVTTRQRELADYFSSSAITVDFLDSKSSWELFCDWTFAQEGCPRRLKRVAKKIVKKCKGLPLAITMIGGLLRKSPRTQNYWKKIAKDKSLILKDSGEGSKVLSILYLSYNHLPVFLKPCFLYMGLFPEDYQIEATLLGKFWVAEGFIKQKTDQSLEEVAESYVHDLAHRNLLLVRDMKLNKTYKDCCVHDLVRELCIRIAEKEKFYCVQRSVDGTRHFVVDERSAGLFRPQQSLTTSIRPPSVIEPLIFDGKREAPPKSRLLRVHVDHMGYSNFLQVSMRFLFCQTDPLGKFIPWSISQCWSLQTFIVRGAFSVKVSPEIWKMPQLRHIDICRSYLFDPPSDDDDSVLENLQSLKGVRDLSFSDDLCKRIPNIKVLEIEYDFSENGGSFHLHKVGCLNKLESLHVYANVRYRNEYVGGLLQNLKLPLSLKELNLWHPSHLGIDVATISLLPCLEILELHGKVVVEAEWRGVEEYFPCLKHLTINGCDDLTNWIAESSSFPVLETLSLLNLDKLEEIPSGFGEIATLETMHVYECSESASISAMKILEEQESLGNESLQLQLHFKYQVYEQVRKIIKQMGYTSKNLHISSNVITL